MIINVIKLFWNQMIKKIEWDTQRDLLQLNAETNFNQIDQHRDHLVFCVILKPYVSSVKILNSELSKTDKKKSVSFLLHKFECSKVSVGSQNHNSLNESLYNVFLAAIAALYVVMSVCLSIGLSVCLLTTSFKKFEFVLKCCYKCNKVHRSILWY